MEKQEYMYKFSKILADIKKGKEVKPMGIKEKETKPNSEVINREKRKYLRFNIDLPVR